MLVAHLIETEWDDGEARQTSTLLLFAEEGRWKGMINDRDAGAVAFVSGDCLRAVLASIEKGLDGGNLDWRPTKSKQGRGRG